MITVRSIGKCLAFRRLGLIDVALSGNEDFHIPSPAGALVDGAASLRLDYIAVDGMETRECIRHRHALTARESNPVVAFVDGDFVVCGIDRNACQRDLACCAGLDLIHLSDVEGHRSGARLSPLSVGVGDGAALRLDGGSARGSHGGSNGVLEVLQGDVEVGRPPTPALGQRHHLFDLDDLLRKVGDKVSVAGDTEAVDGFG